MRTVYLMLMLSALTLVVPMTSYAQNMRCQCDHKNWIRQCDAKVELGYSNDSIKITSDTNQCSRVDWHYNGFANMTIVVDGEDIEHFRSQNAQPTASIESCWVCTDSHFSEKKKRKLSLNSFLETTNSEEAAITSISNANARQVRQTQNNINSMIARQQSLVEQQNKQITRARNGGVYSTTSNSTYNSYGHSDTDDALDARKAAFYSELNKLRSELGSCGSGNDDFASDCRETLQHQIFAMEREQSNFINNGRTNTYSAGTSDSCSRRPGTGCN